jgi:hypothetical protein
MTEIEKETGMTDLCVQADKFHKSQMQIINDLVREKLAVGV